MSLLSTFVNFHNDVLFLENIFTQQPSYYSDLEETVPTVLQVSSDFQKENCIIVDRKSMNLGMLLFIVLFTFLWRKESIFIKWFTFYFVSFYSPWGVWYHLGKMWSPLWRSHSNGASETACTQTPHCHDHEPAGQTIRMQTTLVRTQTFKPTLKWYLLLISLVLLLWLLAISIQLTGLLMTGRLSNNHDKGYILIMAVWIQMGWQYCYKLIWVFFPGVGTYRSYFVPLWLNHYHPCLPGHLPCCVLYLPLPWFPQQVNRWSKSDVLWLTKAFRDHFVLCPGRLTSFYETTVPDLEKAVRKRNFDDKGLVLLPLLYS